MQRECSIFFYQDYVSFAPTILNLSKLLDKYGYKVNIFATENKNILQPQEIVGSKVKFIYFPRATSYLFFQKLGLSIAGKILEISTFSFQCFAEVFKSNAQLKKTQSNINIGVDLHGSIVALLCFYFFKQKFVFLSLELEEPAKSKFVSKLFIKKVINLAYRNSDFVIVQDEDRFKTLGEYYQYQHPKVFYLPNSTLNDCPDTSTRNFFRKKFDLDKEKFPYIILHAGMIGDHVCSKSLAHAFASINNGCALIFHGVDSKRLEDPYIQSLQQVNSKNLFLSLNPVPFDQVNKIYASSTIGLAFYADKGNNFTKIAMASGKLTFYLKHGKPVLVSNFPSLYQLVEKYKIGFVINDPSDAQEINLAIDKILGSYDTYSNNAKLCFQAEFDFETKVKPILSVMNAL